MCPRCSSFLPANSPEETTTWAGRNHGFVLPCFSFQETALNHFKWTERRLRTLLLTRYGSNQRWDILSRRCDEVEVGRRCRVGSEPEIQVRFIVLVRHPNKIVAAKMGFPFNEGRPWCGAGRSAPGCDRRHLLWTQNRFSPDGKQQQLRIRTSMADELDVSLTCWR